VLPLDGVGSGVGSGVGGGQGGEPRCSRVNHPHSQFCQDWPKIFQVFLSWAIHSHAHRAVHKHNLMTILRFSRFFIRDPSVCALERCIELSKSWNSESPGVRSLPALPSLVQAPRVARMLPRTFPMLPIWHIEPFLHHYRDLFCCNHPNWFCEATNLYAICYQSKVCDQWVHTGHRDFSTTFWRSCCLSTSVEGAVSAEELYATFERAEAKLKAPANITHTGGAAAGTFRKPPARKK
jgi:hypothetical protein